MDSNHHNSTTQSFPNNNTNTINNNNNNPLPSSTVTTNKRKCTDNNNNNMMMISNVKKSHIQSCNNTANMNTHNNNNNNNMSHDHDKYADSARNNVNDDKRKFHNVTDDVHTRQLRLALDQCNVSYAMEGEDLDLVQAFDSSVSEGFVGFLHWKYTYILYPWIYIYIYKERNMEL